MSDQPKTAGRPRIGDGAIARSVSLSKEDWDKLNVWGDQNASKGVRKAIVKGIAWDKYLESLKPSV